MKVPVNDYETLDRLFSEYQRQEELNGLAMLEFERWRKNTREFLKGTLPEVREILIDTLMTTCRYEDQKQYLEELRR